MPITHIVLFEFKPIVELEIIKDVCNRMLALSSKCLHPTTNKPYVTSASGGRNNSPEGHQVGGYSHGFISHFDNEEDRRYYLEEDPVHLEFVKSLDGIIQSVRVCDFVDGHF